MDVLELPRPVINFLRTMAKEGCRYVLSWDIFGGTDTVTLTLTWKLNENESQLSISKSPSQPIYDDLCYRHNESLSSPHCSRRDENTLTSSKNRCSRGKSLEGNNITSNKQTTHQQKQISSLERSSSANRQKTELDSIYANLSNTTRTNSPSPSFQFNRNQTSSLSNTHQHRTKVPCEIPMRRKLTPSTPILGKKPLESKRANHIPIQTDEDEDIVDPWIKHFERSMEQTNNNPKGKHNDDITKTGCTSGKVKFKRKPDYF